MKLNKDRRLKTGDGETNQGGNPTDNFTAPDPGWIVPSAARMMSGGSTHVRSRMAGGRSVARIIRNSPTSGGSPSRNTTGRRLTIAASAARAATSRRGTLILGEDAGEHPTGGKVRDGNARVVGDVAAQLEAARDLLRMVAFDSSARKENTRAAEHEIEGLALGVERVGITKISASNLVSRLESVIGR